MHPIHPVGYMPMHELDVKGLQTYFFTEGGVARAVDGASFQLEHGQVLAIVGESGCGKSVTALSIMGLLSPPGRIVGGEAWFEGRNLFALSEKEMQSIRGNRISMIFQEPMTSLNPVFRIQDQIAEVLERHRQATRKEALEQVVDLLGQVGIANPKLRMRDYPHQMSGGMRQRAMIAMALACRPQILIADEPTTALDVTIQAQILALLQEMRESTGTSILLITHDLGVVAETAEEVVVMYAGRVVESAPVRDLFESPLHPYTQGLMHSIPARRASDAARRLDPIPGVVPSLLDLPPGCKFNTRCSYAFDRCFVDPEPPLFVPAPNRGVRCWLLEKESSIG
ncbi:MAG: ABC transporter ATP-binding protein [Syntrophobacteraceae bacterium]